MTHNQLSEAERVALRWASEGELVSRIPDRTERDLFGGVEAPGRVVFRKLMKLGLLFETEEDGDWTPSLGLTPEGEALLKELK